MSLVRDPNADLSSAKPIALGGKEYHVAPLPLRQVLALADLESKIGQGASASERITPLIEIVRRALSKVYPQITDDDLLDDAITLDDLYAALPVIMQQAGAKGVASVEGELKATSGSEASIG